MRNGNLALNPDKPVVAFQQLFDPAVELAHVKTLVLSSSSAGMIRLRFGKTSLSVMLVPQQSSSLGAGHGFR